MTLKTPILFGVLLLTIGLLVPETMLLGLLRGPGALDNELLRRGALMWRILAGATGLFLLASTRLGYWKNQSTVPHRPPSRASLAAILVLTAVAAVLRLHALGLGMWVDEVTTLVDYVRPPLGEIVTTYSSQNQHLLYSVLAHLSFALFGESTWSLRLPAAIFGIASVWAIWRLGREVANDREGLLAALLLTVSYQHVWFSQNARGYSGLLFWTLLSSALLVRALREQRPALWGAYAVAVALGMGTHLTMLFVSLGQFVAWAWMTRQEAARARLQPLLTGFIFSGLLTLLLYSLVLPQIPGANATDVSDIATWRSPLWALRETLVGLQLKGLGGATLAAGAAVVGIGLVSYARRSPFIPILLLMPVISGGAITIASGHHLWPRFFFFAAGFGILVVVRGLNTVALWLADRLRVRGLSGPRLGTAITILLALAMARGLPWAYRPKQDYGGARDFVRADLSPGDTVVVVGVAALAYGRYYAPEWRAVTNADELTAARRPEGRTWLLCTLPIALRAAHPDLVALLERDFTLVREFEGSLNGGNVLVYRADPAKPPRGH